MKIISVFLTLFFFSRHVERGKRKDWNKLNAKFILNCLFDLQVFTTKIQKLP